MFAHQSFTNASVYGRRYAARSEGVLAVVLWGLAHLLSRIRGKVCALAWRPVSGISASVIQIPGSLEAELGTEEERLNSVGPLAYPTVGPSLIRRYLPCTILNESQGARRLTR